MLWLTQTNQDLSLSHIEGGKDTDKTKALLAKGKEREGRKREWEGEKDQRKRKGGREEGMREDGGGEQEGGRGGGVLVGRCGF